MEIMYIEQLRKNNEDNWAWTPIIHQFDVEADFAIDEDNLNKEICKVGSLLVKYGTAAAEQEANLKRKEEYVKLTKARVSSYHRSEAERNGIKLTKDQVDDLTIQDDNYQAVLSQLHLLRADSLKTDHWWRSIVKKAELLNGLAFRQNAEIKRMG